MGKTTDQMTNYATGAVRDTGGKGRCDLLPMCALLRVSRHMENALTHYPERNWEKGMPIHAMIDSAIRHLFKYMDGMNDEDHLTAAATNLLMALWTEEKMPEMQDIPTRMPKPFAGSAGGKGGNGTTPHTIIAYTNMGDVPDDGQIPDQISCSCYDLDQKRCRVTREVERCNCGGDEKKCDFYPEKRMHLEGGFA